MLKILFFGDITGEPGRKAIRLVLPGLIESEKPDLVMANVENLAHGKGVTVKTLEELDRLGVQGFTGGNHIFSKREFSEAAMSKFSERLVRPANIAPTHAGSTAIKLKTSKGLVLVGNFLGQVFMEKQFHDPIESPFAQIGTWLERNQTAEVVSTVMDFHAEATSEKVAFGYVFDGKVRPVRGT